MPSCDVIMAVIETWPFINSVFKTTYHQQRSRPVFSKRKAIIPILPVDFERNIAITLVAVVRWLTLVSSPVTYIYFLITNRNNYVF